MSVSSARLSARHAARGATMVEFIVVAPLLIVFMLLALHFGLLYHARSQVNYATFMAARAGSVQHADLKAMRLAYLDAIVPLYGGGENAAELAASRQRAEADAEQWIDIDILNPQTASYDDWSDPALSIAGFAGRAIPNTGLENRDPAVLGVTSKQNVQDANVLKIRVWHAHATQVPVVTSQVLASLISFTGSPDPRLIDALNQQRWPLVSYVSVQMQTEPVEPN